MPLIAHARRTTGGTTHLLGGGPSGGVTPLEAASRLEIVNATDGVTLIRYSARGAFVGDTWHASVEEAMRQAKFEFDTEPSDWSESETGA
jgi:hypothetical protein